MHAVVYRVTINEQEEANRLLHEEFVPGVSQAPGFIAGYWVQTGENHGTSVIVFQSEEDVRRVVDQPAPETGALTVETVEVGQVVAQA